VASGDEPQVPSTWPRHPIVYCEAMSDHEHFRGAGGTEGGVGMFLIGFVMAVAGGYLLTTQVTVTSGYWRLWGYNAFGLSLLPFIVGIAFLFFDGRSVVGWVLTIAGAVIIVAGILTNLEIYFRSTSLFNTLVMLMLLFGGIGLVARALKPRA
jgi:hypothetical protein